MRIERTKNASRNIVFGLIMKMVQILLPFITRTVIIYVLGIQYLGLSSLFTSILQMLNMAELGVGTAMVYSMYEPIAKDDKERVCALLNLYKLYYRIIGIVIAVIGLVLLPYLPRLISGSTPADINIYVLYLLNLSATVASYWLLAYKGSVLSAHQREDIPSKVRLTITVVQNVVQIILLFITKNYYAFVITMLLAQIATNIVIAFFADRLYPQYKAAGRLDKEITKGINGQIRDLFTSKLGSVVFSSADSLIISAFLGLEMVAIYQNYYYIANSLIGIMQIVFSACLAGIGNSIITETKEKNFDDLSKLSFLISWIAGVCSACLVCLYQPFMKIWVGEELMLSQSFVVCMSIFFYEWELYRLINVYKDAAGLWHTDRFRPLVTALTNLTLNILMVHFWGVNGVILSTVVSVLVIGFPWLIHNLFSSLFERGYMFKYVCKLLKYMSTTAVSIMVTYLVCTLINIKSDWGTLILRAMICVVIPNAVFLVTYFRTKEFNESIVLADRITKGKFKLSKIYARFVK